MTPHPEMLGKSDVVDAEKVMDHCALAETASDRSIASAAAIAVCAPGFPDGVLSSDSPEVKVPDNCPGPAIMPRPAMPLGPLAVGRVVIDGNVPPAENLTGVLFVPDDRCMTLDGGTALDVRAGDVVVLSARGQLRSAGPRPLSCTALLASRRFLGSAMPSRLAVIVLPRSGSVDALRRHVERLHALGPAALAPAQAKAAARSVRELLAAAAVPVAAVRQRCVQREEALLDRIVDHVDATLGTDVSIASLCEGLGCSRSALYRAAAPRGGLVELVTRQRLVAAYQALGRRDDRRSIAAIARAHGFADASQFSRRFRRAFGVSAGHVRSASAQGPADGVLCHPDTTRLFALADGGTDGGTRGSG